MRLAPVIALTLFSCVAAAPRTANAQTCSGNPSFTAAPGHLGVGLGLGSDGRAIGLSGAGGNESLFGIAHVTFESIDDTDVTGTTVGGTLGMERHADLQKKVSWCPMAGISYGKLSGDELLGVDISGWTVGGGVSLGIQTSDPSASTAVIPTVGFAINRTSVNVGAFGISASEADVYAMARVGVGFVFNQRMGIVPMLSMPIGLEGGGTMFGVDFTFGFGN